MGKMVLLLALATVIPAAAGAQASQVAVEVIKQPYKGARNVPELSMNPDYIHAAGLERLLAEEDEYGAWHRLGLANGHFADRVRATGVSPNTEHAT